MNTLISTAFSIRIQTNKISLFKNKLKDKRTEVPLPSSYFLEKKDLE